MLSSHGKVTIDKQSLRTDAMLGAEQVGALDALLWRRRQVALPAALHLAQVPVVAAGLEINKKNGKFIPELI